MSDRFDKWVSGLDDSRRQYYVDKLAQWTSNQRAHGIELAAALEKMGCRDPEGWAFSEVSENIAQVLRFAFLMGVTKEIEQNAKFGIERLVDDNPAVATAVTKIQGALSEDELRVFLAAFGKQLADDILYMIDQGCSSQIVDPKSSWALLEMDTECRPTGRDVGGLHEDLWEDDFRPNI